MTTIEPMILISISLAIGAFLGAFLMFMSMYNYEQRILKELDSKSKQLEMYENKYDDDDYEAY